MTKGTYAPPLETAHTALRDFHAALSDYVQATRIVDSGGAFLATFTRVDGKGVDAVLLSRRGQRRLWGAEVYDDKHPRLERGMRRRLYGALKTAPLVDITASILSGHEDRLLATLTPLLDVSEKYLGRFLLAIQKKSKSAYNLLVRAKENYLARIGMPNISLNGALKCLEGRLGREEAEKPIDFDEGRNQRSAIAAVAMYLAPIVGGAAAAKEATDLFHLNWGDLLHGWSTAAAPDSDWPAEKTASQVADESGIDLIRDLEGIVSVPAPENVSFSGAVSKNYIVMPTDEGELIVYDLNGTVKAIRKVSYPFRVHHIGDDRFVYCSTHGDETILENFRTGEQKPFLDSCTRSASTHPDIAFLWASNGVYIIDKKSEIIWTASGHPPTIAQKGNELLIAKFGGQSAIEVLDLGTKQSSEVPLPGPAYLSLGNYYYNAEFPHYLDPQGNLVFAVASDENESAIKLLTYDGSSVSDTGIVLTPDDSIAGFTLGAGVAAWIKVNEPTSYYDYNSAPPRTKAIDFGAGKPVKDLGINYGELHIDGHRLIDSGGIGRNLGNVVQYDFDSGEARVIEPNAIAERLRANTYLLFREGTDSNLLMSSDKAVLIRDMDWWASGAGRLAWISGGQLHFASLDDVIKLIHTKPLPGHGSEDAALRQLAINQAPTLILDSRERFRPTSPYGDGDDNVLNNPQGWPAKFPARPVVLYAVRAGPDGKQYVQYWTHYVWNEWRGADEHGLDNELFSKEILRQSGEVLRTSASMHLWNNIYKGNLSEMRVENGSHGMSVDGKSFFLEDFGQAGRVLTPADYDLVPLENVKPYDAQDFPGDRGKFPTLQERYLHPELAFEAVPYPRAFQFGIKASPKLDLIIKDPRLAVQQDGENVFAVNNFGPGFLDSVAFRTTGLRDETYTASVKVEYPGAIKVAERSLAIKRGLQQVMSISGRGLEIDKTGDGVADEFAPFNKVPTKSSGSVVKPLDWRVPATAIGIGGGSTLGYAAWRSRRRKDGGDLAQVDWEP